MFDGIAPLCIEREIAQAKVQCIDENAIPFEQIGSKEFCTEWNETDEHVEEDTQENEIPVGFTDVFKDHRVAEPHNAQNDEADEIAEEVAADLMKGMDEVVQVGRSHDGQRNIDHEDGHCNGKDPIAHPRAEKYRSRGWSLQRQRSHRLSLRVVRSGG